MARTGQQPTLSTAPATKPTATAPTTPAAAGVDALVDQWLQSYLNSSTCSERTRLARV